MVGRLQRTVDIIIYNFLVHLLCHGLQRNTVATLPNPSVLDIVNLGISW